MNNSFLKFATNISTMFREFDILDRVVESRRNGFSAFEAQNLYDVNMKDFLTVKEVTGLEMVLINSPPDIREVKDSDPTYFGYACIPGKENEFWRSFMQAVRFAKEVDCKKIHILAGLKYENDFSEMRKTYINNLRKAASVLESEKLIGVIEPLCPEVKAFYFLDSFDLAVECVKEVNSDNLKLLLDIFHLQMIHGDALNLINQYYPYAGHLQVSQAPNREEPSAKGLINYKNVFELLMNKQHADYIGLEYTPKGSTAESLNFLRPSGYFALNLRFLNDGI